MKAGAPLVAIFVVLVLSIGSLSSGKEELVGVDLAIPGRVWDPSRPDKSVGWCAEACVQMAMAYYGVEVSQAAINRAGRPDHPDLYLHDIDEALDTLGVCYKAWDESVTDVSDFVAWIKDQLAAGYPVLCGVKIYPDEQPDWSLDHFVLAVGYDQEGLILNTQLDLDGQVVIAYLQLASRKCSYAFENRFHNYHAWAITGLCPRENREDE